MYFYLFLHLLKPVEMKTGVSDSGAGHRAVWKGREDNSKLLREGRKRGSSFFLALSYSVRRNGMKRGTVF